MFTSTIDVNSLTSRVWNVFGEFLIRLTFSFNRVAVNRVLKEKFGSEYPTIAVRLNFVCKWPLFCTGTVCERSLRADQFAASDRIRCSNFCKSHWHSRNRLKNACATPWGLYVNMKHVMKCFKYWEEILNRRAKTVLLSFGTMAKSSLLSEASKAGILQVALHAFHSNFTKLNVQAFSQFPEVTFIWKYEETDDDFCKNDATKLENLVMTKWMPQVDILSEL